MSVLQCLACQHESPATAKFCSECGGQLNLMLCKQCEAINQRAWQRCYNCGAEFASQPTAHPPLGVVAPVTSKPSEARRMRRSRILVSVLAFGTVAGLAFYLYTQPDLNRDKAHVGRLPAAVDISTAKTQASVVPVSTSPQQRVKRADQIAPPAKPKKSAAVAVGGPQESAATIANDVPQPIAKSPAGASAAAGDTSSAKAPKPLAAEPTVRGSARAVAPNDFHFIAPPP